jgi:hypothetical protein
LWMMRELHAYSFSSETDPSCTPLSRDMLAKPGEVVWPRWRVEMIHARAALKFWHWPLQSPHSITDECNGQWQGAHHKTPVMGRTTNVQDRKFLEIDKLPISVIARKVFVIILGSSPRLCASAHSLARGIANAQRFDAGMTQKIRGVTN